MVAPVDRPGTLATAAVWPGEHQPASGVDCPAHQGARRQALGHSRKRAGCVMTADQLQLFPVAPVFVAPAPAPALTIGERFEAFHAANPWVCDALVTLTREMVARGRTRIGVK